MADLPKGMVECGDCQGKGKFVSRFGPAYDQDSCENCAGKGFIPCEHWETDRGHCLDCGGNLVSDQIDQAMNQLEK